MNFSAITVKENFTIGEEIANAVSHCVGACLAIAAMVLLIVKGATEHRGALYIVSVILYSFTLLFLFLNSTLYHALVPHKAKSVYRRFDHLSIYLLIAGTYMPFCLISIGGALGIVLCSVQGVLAILGVIFKSIWIEKHVTLHTFIFLLMGWMIIFMAKPLYLSIGLSGIILLIAGGVAYSIGTLFFLYDWFKFHHFIWHLLVIAGAVLHFFSIYFYV